MEVKKYAPCHVANEGWSKDLNPSLFQKHVMLAPILWCKPYSFANFLFILCAYCQAFSCVSMVLSPPTISSTPHNYIYHSFIHSTYSTFYDRHHSHWEEYNINDSTYHKGLLWELNKLHKVWYTTWHIISIH